MESGEVMYKEKITQMEQDFKNMHEELTSEIKLLRELRKSSLEKIKPIPIVSFFFSSDAI